MSKKVISNGIIFIWSDKSQILEILDVMEKKGFSYIENLVVVQLSLKKAFEELKKIMNVECNEDSVLNSLDRL